MFYYMYMYKYLHVCLLHVRTCMLIPVHAHKRNANYKCFVSCYYVRLLVNNVYVYTMYVHVYVHILYDWMVDMHT